MRRTRFVRTLSNREYDVWDMEPQATEVEQTVEEKRSVTMEPRKERVTDAKLSRSLEGPETRDDRSSGESDRDDEPNDCHKGACYRKKPICKNQPSRSDVGG